MSMQGSENEQVTGKPESRLKPADTRLAREFGAVASVSSVNPGDDESAIGVPSAVDQDWDNIKPILIGGEETLAKLQDLSDRYDAGEKVSDMVMAEGYSLLSVVSDAIRNGSSIMTGPNFDECVNLVNELMQKERILARYTEVFGHGPETIPTLATADETDDEAETERLIQEARIRVLNTIGDYRF